MELELDAEYDWQPAENIREERCDVIELPSVAAEPHRGDAVSLFLLMFHHADYCMTETVILMKRMIPRRNSFNSRLFKKIHCDFSDFGRCQKSYPVYV